MNNLKEIKKVLLCKELGLRHDLIEGDVYDGDITLIRRKVSNILIKFSQLGIRKVNGWFNCSNNKLTSLEGCPEEVGRNFWCDNNNLTSIEGGLLTVGGNIWCNDNELILERPEHCKIGGEFINE